jgi:hypothetical protein
LKQMVGNDGAARETSGVHQMRVGCGGCARDVAVHGILGDPEL